MRFVEIVVVKGAEGPSLHLWGKDGGKRLAGPKAWGNPYNEPAYKFTVDVDELIAEATEHAQESKATP